MFDWVENIKLTLLPSLQIKPRKYSPENMCDILFQKTKGGYAEKELSKGFFRKGLIRNFAEFTSKHVPESLFLVKLNSVDLQLLLKRDSSAGALL